MKTRYIILPLLCICTTMAAQESIKTHRHTEHSTHEHLDSRKVAELYVTADNLLDKAYQNHLSRLKYADENTVTGRRGVFNMGRNITFKLVIPIQIIP